MQQKLNPGGDIGPTNRNISIKKQLIKVDTQPTSCLSGTGNAFVSGAEGLRFKSCASQIKHSVANGLPLLQHFFKRSCVAWLQ